MESFEPAITSTPAIVNQTPPRSRISSPIEDCSPVFRSQARVRRYYFSQFFDEQAPPIETPPPDEIPNIVAGPIPFPTAVINDVEDIGSDQVSPIETTPPDDTPNILLPTASINDNGDDQAPPFEIVPSDDTPNNDAGSINIAPVPPGGINDNEDHGEPRTDEVIFPTVGVNDNEDDGDQAPPIEIAPSDDNEEHGESGTVQLIEEQSGDANTPPDTQLMLAPVLSYFSPIKIEASDNDKSTSKKRKRSESLDDDDDDGSCCTICFESWTNSGEHRIASLKCGHFFGYSCIDKWLRGSGASCPNCKDKCTKKDIRVHYIAKLKAIDTSEKDRALLNLKKTKSELQDLQLRHTQMQVRLQLQLKHVDKLSQDIKRFRGEGGSLPPMLSPIPSSQAGEGKMRLIYQKRHDICKPSSDRDKCCRVMSYCQPLGLLVMSQPSFTALAPGFGVRRYSMLDQKLGNFMGVHREVIRDLVFHPIQHELLLSCGQDKTAVITNMSTNQVVTRFTTDSEVWAAEWSHTNANIVFLATKRSQILIFDTHSPTAPSTTLTFPGTERRPIISLKFIPASPARGFPFPGLLAMTLGSLWFWSHHQGTDWVPHRLPIDAKLLWSMEFEPESRLVLVSCRPSPQAVHLVIELNCTLVNSQPVVTCRTVMKQASGGSYSARSFLRSTLIPGKSGETLLVFGRGTGQTDHRVIVQDVGSQRVVQEINIGRPVLDLCQANINGERRLAVLGETELTMYKWQ